MNRRPSRIASVAPAHPLSELEPQLIKRGVLMPLLSVIVPVKNAEAAIAPFVERVSAILDAIALNQSWEILFVDDGSSDATLAAIAAANNRERRVRALSLSREFGREAALSAALDHARGRAVIPMDVDRIGQSDALPQMIGKWLDGYEVVLGTRAGASDFHLLDRKVADVVRKLPERNRSMKALCAWAGFRQAAVEYDGAEPESGYWTLALDAMKSAFTVPLRIWTYIGAIVSLFAFGYAAIVAVEAIVFRDPVPGYVSILVPALFLVGIQLISLGVLGEYVGRILTETKQRPLYVVRDTVGIDGDVTR